jgi:hypothetical protein
MPTSEPRFTARFDRDLLDEDRTRSTAAGGAAARAARDEYERNGVPFSHLRPVDEHGRDGTLLPDCVKVYLPYPDGRFGMLFQAVAHEHGPRFRYLAFGVRHHPKGSHAPTVYEIAHRRLNN